MWSASALIALRGRHPAWTPILLIVLIAVGMACGGNAETSGQPTTAVPTPTAALAENASDGDLSINVRGGLGPLDPAHATDSAAAAVIVEVFDALVTFDHDLRVVPNLARTWAISPDGLEYTFALRDDVQFHSGRRVTAEDVRLSLERAVDPATGSPLAGFYLGDIEGVAARSTGAANEVSGISVLDDATLRIRLTQPSASFLARMGQPVASVVDVEQIAADPQGWALKPNATGPFMVAELAPGERLVLEANPEYHLGPPLVASVTLRAGGDDADIAPANVSGAVPDPSTTIQVPELQTYFVALNTSRAPFDDVLVRRAFAAAIDRAAMAAAFPGLRPAAGILPPGMPGFDAGRSAPVADPDAARDLLAQSGYGGGLPAIALSTAGGVDVFAAAIASSWTSAFDVTVDINPGAPREFQAFYGGWIADYPAPDNFLDLHFRSDSPGNVTGYANPEVDRLLLAAQVALNDGERLGLYQQAEQIILDDVVWIPLFHAQSTYAVSARVKGFEPPPFPIPHLRFVSVSD